MMTLDSLTRVGSLTGRVYTPKDVKYDEKGNIKSYIDTYYRSIDAVYEGVIDLQKKGIVSKDAAAPVQSLSYEQKQYLADKYNISDMMEQDKKTAFLNELVEFGVIAAEEAVRSTYVAYTNLENAATTYVHEDGFIVRGLTMTSSLTPPTSIYEEKNFMNYIKASLENDALYGSSQQTIDAKNHVLELLNEIFSSH
jgi:hypothetical protein